MNVFQGLGSAGSEELTERLLGLTHAIEELPFPTIASIHSLCVTAGLELALACDMIWAAESARFGLVEAVIGLTPLMGGTQRVAERAGAARAREFVMSGDLYDAATLERWGVVNRVLPDAELREQTLEFARRLADGPDARACRDQEHRARVPRRRRARRRRSHRGDRRSAVRDRGSAGRGGQLPGRGPGQGALRGALTDFRRSGW